MRKVMSVVNGVVEMVERKPAESLSAGMFNKREGDWKPASPAEEHIAKHYTIELAPQPTVYTRRPNKLRKPADLPQASGVIYCAASPKPKSKTYKQEGLQKRVKKLAGFAGWK